MSVGTSASIAGVRYGGSLTSSRHSSSARTICEHKTVRERDPPPPAGPPPGSASPCHHDTPHCTGPSPEAGRQAGRQAGRHHRQSQIVTQLKIELSQLQAVQLQASRHDAGATRDACTSLQRAGATVSRGKWGMVARPPG
eukprot:COSAG02_NODE_2693_length_8220_cov_3.340106_6_plen_140_part_00